MDGHANKNFEEVTVNGMTMYKQGSKLFLEPPVAEEDRLEAVFVCFNPNYDVFEDLLQHGYIRAIKL